MFQDIESYLVRRAVCNLTTKNYNRTFLSILNKMRKEKLPNRDLLRRELSQLKGDSDMWPSDEPFEGNLIHSPIYSYNILGPWKTQMILRAIELELMTPKSEGIGTPRILTVEHVMPQSPKNDEWPYPQIDPGQPSWLIQRWRIMQTLGNLTLLTQSLNSAISNGPFSTKRSEIAKQSQLRLNAYFQQFKDDYQWDEVAILKRGGGLAKLALRIWPGPESVTS